MRNAVTEHSFEFDRSAVRDFCKFSNKKAYDRVMMDSLDCFYHVPTREHKYIVRGTPIVRSDTDMKYSYMSQVIKRAKSTVDPRKYSRQIDWRMRSKQQLKGLLERQKKISYVDQFIKAKKQVPGPTVYTNWIKPKTKGFYGKRSPRVFVSEEMMEMKKKIPSSTQYDTFKGLSQEIKDRNKMKQNTAELDRKRKDFEYRPLAKTK